MRLHPEPCSSCGRNTNIVNNSDTSHYENVPFEVPENWEWVNIMEILLKLTDGTHHSPKNYHKGNYKYITAKNIKNEGVVLDGVNNKFTTKSGTNKNPIPITNIISIRERVTTCFFLSFCLFFMFNTSSIILFFKKIFYIVDLEIHNITYNII